MLCYASSGNWYPAGKITHINSDCSLNIIVYDDGDVEEKES